MLRPLMWFQVQIQYSRSSKLLLPGVCAPRIHLKRLVLITALDDFALTQREACPDRFRYQSNNTRAGDCPNVDRNAADWRPGETKHPFDWVGYPVLREVEHRLLAVVGIAQELQPLRA